MCYEEATDTKGMRSNVSTSQAHNILELDVFDLHIKGPYNFFNSLINFQAIYGKSKLPSSSNELIQLVNKMLYMEYEIATK